MNIEDTFGSPAPPKPPKPLGPNYIDSLILGYKMAIPFNYIDIGVIRVWNNNSQLIFGEQLVIKYIMFALRII